MTEQPTGIFYDGKTSVPQNVVVSLDGPNGILHFQTQSDQYQWEIKSVTLNRNKNGVTLVHGKELRQQLELSDSDLIAQIQYSKSHIQNSWYERLISYGVQVHVLVALAIMALIVASYLYVVPWIGEKSVALIPEDYDNKLGDAFFDQNMMFTTVDTARSKALNQFAQELKLNNTKKLHFTVVESETVNAFALPNGNIVIYTGILKEMKSYDELVALLGHEVSHVNERHAMKMMCRNLSGYLLISTILGDVNGVMATIGDNINSLQSLSFSREFEQQADLEGFKIVVANKVNPQGVSNLFKRLKQSDVMVPEFLSSHPMTQERIRYIDKMIKSESFQIVENPKLKSLFKVIK